LNRSITTSEQQIKPGLTPKAQIITLIIGIILIATTLRAPFTSVGPLVDLISKDLGINHTLIGLLTTFPLLAFALISPLAPKLSYRLGAERAVFLGTAIVLLGILIRYMPSSYTLFLGTIILGIGIAISNVLIPSIIKNNFPLQIGIMTGIYSVAMNVFAAVGSGISIPLANIESLGWRGSLVFWSLLLFIALLIWIPQLKKKQPGKNVTTSGATSIWRSKLAWKVTTTMGVQSFIFYSVVTWLPEILIEKGISASTSGWLLSLLQVAGVPVTFVVPIIAAKLKNQRAIILAIFICFVLGFSALLIGSSLLLPVGIVLIGVGTGAAFGLTTMFFILRTRDSFQAAQLSGMAQSIGYLLAATGPLFLGLVHDISGNWSVAIGVLLVSSFIFIYTGWSAAKNDYVTVANK